MEVAGKYIDFGAVREGDPGSWTQPGLWAAQDSAVSSAGTEGPRGVGMVHGSSSILP